MKIGVKKVIVSLLCILLAMGLLGCTKSKSDANTPSTASSNSSNAAKGGMQTGNSETTSQADNAKGSSTQTNTQQSNSEDRKVIKKSKIEVETKHFDEALNFITERTDKDKGFIQNSNIQGGKQTEGQYALNRYAEFTLRIPVDKLNTFLKDAETIGVIVNRSDNDEDVTSQYFDTEARVKTLKIEEDRLLAILQKSDKLSDVIELEKRLSEIRNEIESLTGTLKKYDNLVALATLNVIIREVQTENQIKAKPVTFGAKIVDGFKQSAFTLFEILKGIVIALVYVLPFAAVGAIVFVPGRVLYRRYNKKKEGKELAEKENKE